MRNTVCVPKQTENLLTLSPLYRDYWGEQMAVFTRKLDGFAEAGCYVPRFYHAPSSESQFNGVQGGAYITYLLKLPVGGFLIGFLHTTCSVPNSTNSQTPPNPSGFTMQMTDLAIDHKLFARPLPEAWFINDNLLGSSVNPPYPSNTKGYTFPSFPRLLSVPYPIVGEGQFQVEFYNSLTSTNTDAQMTFLVLVPDGVNQNAGSK